MRAFSVFALCLLMTMLFSGCARTVSPERAFSYADHDFSVNVQGSVIRLSSDGYTGDASLIGDRLTDVPRDFAATVSVQTKKDAAGETVVSAMSVVYTAPKSLCGVTVTYLNAEDGRAGQARVMLTRAIADGVSTDREMTIDLSAISPAVRDALLAPVGVLLPRGDVVALSPTEKGCYTVTRREGDREAIFTFVVGKSMPTSVTWTSPERVVDIKIVG